MSLSPLRRRAAAESALGRAAALGDGPIIEAVGLSKSYGRIQALSDVSLTLRPGEIRGLCGHNGAGKSTFVKILSGATQPDEGTVLLGGARLDARSPRQAQAAGIIVVDQELSVVPALTVAENLALGSSERSRGAAARALARQRLETVGLGALHPDLPLSRLSMAERQLVEIARALGRRADVLILDEPTATLSDVEIRRVFAAVRRAAEHGCAIVFVSHRLGEVMDLCSSVTVLRDGRLIDTRPTAEISKDDLVRMMLGTTVARHDRDTRHAAAAAGADRELVLDRLAVEGSLEPIDLVGRPGEVIALAGQIGSGSTELLRALAGLEPRASGRAVLGGRALPFGSVTRTARAGVAYVTGDRKGEGLFLGRSVQENLLSTRLRRLRPGDRLRQRRLDAEGQRLSDLIHLQEGRLRKATSTLSGGNQQKVLIGRCLGRSDLAVLLLDEPTRGVDVGGRAEIHALIRAAAADGLLVIFASTELDELLDLSDVIVTMRGGRVIGRYTTGVTAETVLADMTHSEAA